MKEKWVQTSQARWRWSVGVASPLLWASGLTGGSCTLPELSLDQYHCKHLLTQLLVGIQVDKTQHKIDVLVTVFMLIGKALFALKDSDWFHHYKLQSALYKKKHKTELKTSLTMELLGCVLCFDQPQYLDKISQVENIENNLITLILGTTNKHGGDCI